MKILFIIALSCSTYLCFGQVKIGNDINTIDAASLLELDSDTKAFVPTRITDKQMNEMVPLKGAIVFNTDFECIFAFDGTQWKNLCGPTTTLTTGDSAPANNVVGDIWINNTSRRIHLWNGSSWMRIDMGTESGDGIPSPTTVNDPVAGDIYVDRTTGTIYAYDGAIWQGGGPNSVGNGISLSPSEDIELGGDLTRPTVIGTNTTNTLAIRGLTEVNDGSESLLTVDSNSGELRRSSASTFVQREELVIFASEGQQQFSTPLAITDSKKIDVYRNGVKIDFTPLGGNIIEVENDAICFQNDEIRIVQFL